MDALKNEIISKRLSTTSKLFQSLVSLYNKRLERNEDFERKKKNMTHIKMKHKKINENKPVIVKSNERYINCYKSCILGTINEKNKKVLPELNEIVGDKK
jgi:hypothetical protein